MNTTVMNATMVNTGVNTGIKTHDELIFLTAPEIAEQFKSMHEADAVEILNYLEVEKATEVLMNLAVEASIALFDVPELHRVGELLSLLPSERAVAILDGMSADEAADAFQAMDEETRKRLLVLLSPLTRSELKSLSFYPQNSAGALMTTEFLAVPSNWNVGRVLQFIRDVERSRETVYATYVVDPQTSKLIKVVSLRELTLAEAASPILEAGRQETPLTISALDDRAKVARMFRKYDLLAVPVIDEESRLIGIVTVDDVLDAMVEEMSEDTHKFGGMSAIEKPYFQTRLREMFTKRGGWLAVLFIGEMFTASAMQFFEDELEKALVLTMFIPLIVSSGGNSGSQATSLIIRALALREVTLRDWWRVAMRELPTSIALGSALGTIGALRVGLWHFLHIYNYGEYWFLIALTLFLAIVAIITFGSMIGSLLPFVLKACGFDPASASAPLVATLVDVSGIVIYFSIAAVILSGTLL